MAILIGKVAGIIFSSGDYHVIKVSVAARTQAVATFRGDPPKALKTVEYSLYGEWKSHAKYGRQFVIERWERFTGKRLKPMTALEAVLRTASD